MSDAEVKVKVVIELPVPSDGTTLTLTAKQAGELYDQLSEAFGVGIHEQLGFAPGYPSIPQVTQ